MSLISKQIDDLRTYAKDRKGELAKLVSDAADTIEELSAKLSAANMERSSQYYHGWWIPCSERLPDRFGQVLCTFIPSGGTLWTSVIIAHYSDLMGISKPCFWIGDVGKNSFQNITKQVTAWMPLPEGYRGDERENDR